jgi:hypothetical protein
MINATLSTAKGSVYRGDILYPANIPRAMYPFIAPLSLAMSGTHNR